MNSHEHLEHGQSIDVPSGYIARTYGESYYAERLDAHGEPVELSPHFATFAEALCWITVGTRS